MWGYVEELVENLNGEKWLIYLMCVCLMGVCVKVVFLVVEVVICGD